MSGNGTVYWTFSQNVQEKKFAYAVLLSIILIHRAFMALSWFSEKNRVQFLSKYMQFGVDAAIYLAKNMIFLCNQWNLSNNIADFLH